MILSFFSVLKQTTAVQMGFARTSSHLEPQEFFCSASTGNATTGFAFAICGFPEAKDNSQITDVSVSAPTG